MSKQKSALGRGLSALLNNTETDITTSVKPSKKEFDEVQNSGSITFIPISKIETNPFQPRIHFKQEAIEELAISIKEQGIIQPITVRKLGYDKYQIISGERRFRASQLAGLTEVPAYIRIANDQEMLEMAIVENIQREDLNPIEVAVSYKRLIDDCKLTQEELSAKLGKSRTAITNILRLLKLPPAIQEGLNTGALTMGHARALVSIEDGNLQMGIYEMILEEGLSVRQTEELAKNNKLIPKAKKVEEKTVTPIEVSQLEADLKSFFNSKVKIKTSKTGKGSINISFKSEQDLARITELLDL